MLQRYKTITKQQKNGSQLGHNNERIGHTMKTI